jgi:hypothetical protein
VGLFVWGNNSIQSDPLFFGAFMTHRLHCMAYICTVYKFRAIFVFEKTFPKLNKFSKLQTKKNEDFFQ